MREGNWGWRGAFRAFGLMRAVCSCLLWDFLPELLKQGRGVHPRLVQQPLAFQTSRAYGKLYALVCSSKVIHFITKTSFCLWTEECRILMHSLSSLMCWTFASFHYVHSGSGITVYSLHFLSHSCRVTWTLNKV